jgi:hypothetical protein
MLEHWVEFSWQIGCIPPASPASGFVATAPAVPLEPPEAPPLPAAPRLAAPADPPSPFWCAVSAASSVSAGVPSVAPSSVPPSAIALPVSAIATSIRFPDCRRRGIADLPDASSTEWSPPYARTVTSTLPTVPGTFTPSVTGMVERETLPSGDGNITTAVLAAPPSFTVHTVTSSRRTSGSGPFGDVTLTNKKASPDFVQAAAETASTARSAARKVGGTVLALT